MLGGFFVWELLMRWEVRHNNQVWHVFDTVRYTADMAYRNEAEARRMADMLNAKETLAA